MTHKNTPPKPQDGAKTREDRLKQALKANLARRKAQTKQRAGQKNVPEQDKG